VATGFPATEATCRKIGIEFDPWQADLNTAVLAKDADGLYAADTVALSICRQAGKTYDVGGLVFADSIINPGTTTVWTAHRFKVARESFNEMRAWAKSPRLRYHIDYDEITTAAGNETIPFRNGSRIVFAARERGAIRGFTKVRRLVLDEAQILSEQALADLVPTQNQAANPQIIFMGTPPKPTDPSEVWMRLRAEALAGESEGVLYVEFGGDPEADPLDEDNLRRANPSYPARTSRRAILRLHKLLGPEDFPREGLGIWDDDGQNNWLVIPRAAWRSRQVPPSRPSAVSFAVASSYPDAEWTAIAVAGRLGDQIAVQVIDVRAGTGWVKDRLEQLRAQWSPVAVVVRDRGPTAGLHTELKAAQVDMTTPWVRESAAAFRIFVNGVIKADPLPVVHFGQDELYEAVKAGRSKPTGDGWGWDQPRPELEAATLAVWGHVMYGSRAGDPGVWII
jgi:hypothetical protein